MQPWFTTLPCLNLINWEPGEHYHAARFEKDTRYYVIRLSQDLLEDWVITLVNGRIKSKLGQSRTLAFSSFHEGFEHFCAQAHIRHLRGYQLKTINFDNHLLLYLLPFLANTEEKKKLSATKTVRNTHQNKDSDETNVSILINLKPELAHQQLGFAF
jgi:hypothetical protein